MYSISRVAPNACAISGSNRYLCSLCVFKLIDWDVTGGGDCQMKQTRRPERWESWRERWKWRTWSFTWRTNASCKRMRSLEWKHFFFTKRTKPCSLYSKMSPTPTPAKTNTNTNIDKIKMKLIYLNVLSCSLYFFFLFWWISLFKLFYLGEKDNCILPNIEVILVVLYLIKWVFYQ